MKRFFHDTSFWNQPIGPAPAIDSASREMLDFLAEKDDRGFWLNLTRWTIPIYEVNADTPRHRVHRRLRFAHDDGRILIDAAPSEGRAVGHGRDFDADAQAGRIPIPAHARPDPQRDSHMALVDWENGWIWDMWAARLRSDGDWECKSGMKYRADGSGVFDRGEFTLRNGASIHPCGPSRAAGVPALAGTIMHADVLAGRIAHKLAFATQCSALQRFVHPPACWTDGGWPEGLPEGAVVQLDPALDIDALGLSPAAKIVARALQEYGAVNVDVCGGHTLYGQGLYADPLKRTWSGLLEENALVGIKLEHYRVLKMDGLVPQGAGRRLTPGIYGNPA